MSAVTLDRRLVLEARTRTPDGAGGYAEGWEALGVLWAGLAPGAAGTARGAGPGAGITSSATYRITCRAAPPGAPSRPRPGQRFRAGERLFVIEAVVEARAGAAFLTCHTREETSA